MGNIKFPILNIKKLALDIKSRVKKNSDAVICVSGFEGVGKSNLGIELGYLLDRKFDLWGNILYSPTEEELKDKIKKFGKGSVLNLDEAVKVLEKQNWAKQTFIKKTFQVLRGKNLITLLLIPRLEDLNEYFRNWRVMLNICVFYRGWAYLQVPDPYNKFDVWHTKENQHTLDKYMKGETFHTASKADVFKAFSEFKGFLGFVNFPKLPESVEEEYIVLKDKYSLMNLEEMDKKKEAEKEKEKNKEKEEKEAKDRALVHDIEELRANNYSWSRIARKLGITTGKVRYLSGRI